MERVDGGEWKLEGDANQAERVGGGNGNEGGNAK
jgi:hypothetical protein